jgi:hypothetical protein
MHSIFSRTGFTSRSQLIAAWYGGFEPSSDLAGDPADSTADPD